MLPPTTPQFRFVRAATEDELLRRVHHEAERGWIPIAVVERADGSFGVLLRDDQDLGD